VGAVEATVGRWRARLLGVAVAVSVYGLFAVMDFVLNPDPDDCDALTPLVVLCARGIVFLLLALYGTPVLAVVAGLLAVSRRTRQFAGGFGVVVIVCLLALGVWLLGPFE
jgi:hypothetical protein